MTNFKKLVRVADSLSKKPRKRVQDSDESDILGIPFEAWQQYFLDDGGIPVTDYIEDGISPEEAIAQVINDNFQDAMQGITGGGVEAYSEENDFELPQEYIDAVSECSSADVMSKAQDRWGEVEEAPYDAGVRLFYRPFDEDDEETWKPYGYYSAWSHQFVDWND